MIQGKTLCHASIQTCCFFLQPHSTKTKKIPGTIFAPMYIHRATKAHTTAQWLKNCLHRVMQYLQFYVASIFYQTDWHCNIQKSNGRLFIEIFLYLFFFLFSEVFFSAYRN